jgi:cytochrome b subunit of formate dehydrogenase
MADFAPAGRNLHRFTVVRFTASERVQHIVLIVTFTILIVTGLPVLLPSVGSWATRGLFTLRTFLHHTAGVALIALGVYHGFWIVFTEEGRRDFGSVMPHWSDVTDLVHFLRYEFGKVDEPPPFDKFNPFEKFEYFAVVWGSIIMVITGLMMWFFEFTLLLFPKWVYDLVRLIHGYEAILAFLAVILGHLYNVHLKPGVWPMSRVWLDGKMTLTELKHHHPKEYARWLEQQRMQPAGDGDSRVG